MKTKYKVGDKVRVKSLEWYNSNKDENGNVLSHSDECLFFPEEMSTYCGKEFEVIYIHPIVGYFLEGTQWFWADWMFEEELSTKEQ